MKYKVQNIVWLYPGDAAWHFFTIPSEVRAEIDDRFILSKRGWGSLPVTVTIGTTTWKTSIFPDKKTESYLLPLKAEIRKKEHIKVGDKVEVTLEIKD